MQYELQTIHENAVQKSKSFKKAESELLGALDLVDQKRVYLAMGASSLFDYSTRLLGLSEDTAMTFIRVMRKSRKHPALREAVEKGELPLSKARRIISILNNENQKLWIEAAKSMSLRNLDQKIAAEFPGTLKRETVRAVTDEFISVTIRVRKNDFEKFKRAQDLRSKSLGKSASLEETLVATAKEFVERHDPIRRAERVSQARSNAEFVEKTRKTSNISKEIPAKAPVAGRCAGPNEMTLKMLNGSNKIIPAYVLHQVALRDRGLCQHPYADGSRCKNSRFTQIHHLIPRSQGGPHTPENLITLCSGHHRGVHTYKPRS